MCLHLCAHTHTQNTYICWWVCWIPLLGASFDKEGIETQREKTEQEGGWKCKRTDGEIIWLNTQTRGLPRRGPCGAHIPPGTPKPVSCRDHRTYIELTVSFEGQILHQENLTSVWLRSCQFSECENEERGDYRNIPTVGRRQMAYTFTFLFSWGAPSPSPYQTENKGSVLYSWARGRTKSIDSSCSELDANTS